MHPIRVFLLTALVNFSTGMPIVTQDPQSLSSLMEDLPIVSKVSNPEPTPGTILIMPPPLFDPPEPRPDPLFDSASQPFIIAETNRLKAPPIQESRAETLLPFDGAHVHPYATPYTPESLPGTCANSLRCSLARTSAEIVGTILLLISVAYTVLYICDKIIRQIIWTVKTTRSRSPSGSLRLEPELGNKLSESQQVISDMKTPLVKVWCEKGLEKIVFTG